jgi:feruloyl esterase
MRLRKPLTVICTLFVISLSVVTFGLCATPIIECHSIKNINLGPNVIIENATLISATPMMPEHCKVEGFRWPEDYFIVKLPSTWNSRYYQIGNGGAAGAIIERGMDFPLQNGYVAASASGGHKSPPTLPLFAWAYPPHDPIAQQKLNDYCYGSVHEMAVLAKEMIHKYYGKHPSYSYYNACSTGGRQGLIETQRYPEDFDGLVVGAPVHYLSRITQVGIWQAQALLSDPWTAGWVTTKLPMLASAIMNKCDGIDGLVDGLIDDPQNCSFNALSDLVPCIGDVDGPACFTLAQRTAIQKIYDGVPGLLSPAQPYGSEALAPTSGWIPWVFPATPGGVNLGLALGSGFVQWVGLPPSGGGGPGWDWRTYDFYGPDPQTVIANTSEKCDAINPDLWSIKLRGGKILHWMGWADPATGPYQSVEYYENVLNFMGVKETKEFYKLYMIPGTAHCGGGLGCFSTTDLNNMFFAVVDWVEKGIEPKAFIGSRVVSGQVVRTRPICPYPEVARYSGTGSIDDATNFMCVPPIEVRIKPETLNIGSKGEFTAFVTLPEGYDIRNWNIGNLSCEGASAKKVVISENMLIAKFNRQDLKGVPIGDAVTVTVKGTFSQNGKQAQIQGRDTIKIIKPSR